MDIVAHRPARFTPPLRAGFISPVRERAGFTLIEVMVVLLLLVLSLTAIFGAMDAQAKLRGHARNLMLAVNDATRVLEAIRDQNDPNSGCLAPNPNLTPPVGATWDAWLSDDAGGGGKSIQPDPAVNELVVMAATGANPRRVVVTICWREGTRTIGECTWTGVQLQPDDKNGNGVMESPVLLSALITCRA